MRKSRNKHFPPTDVAFHTLCVCVCAQSSPTLCHPMDYSPPGTSFHGILQARILEQVAISSSRGSSRPRDWTWVSSNPCIGRQILYHCIKKEAFAIIRKTSYLKSLFFGLNYVSFCCFGFSSSLEGPEVLVFIVSMPPYLWWPYDSLQITLETEYGLFCSLSIYLFLAAPGLCCYVWAFSSCSE